MKVLIVGACLLVSSVAWAAPILTVNGTSKTITVMAGTTVTVGLQNSPNNQWDCVALIDLAHGGSWAAYVWVNNSTTLAFPIPTTPGTYLFEYEEQCNKSIVQGPTVTVRAAAAPVLTVNGSSAPVTVPSGATVTVSIQNGPGNQWDCVSLNTSPNANAGWVNYAFLTPFSTTGTVTFTMPSAAGTYGVLFWQNCNTWMMTGPSMTVAVGAITTLTINGSNAPVTVPSGATVTVSIQNGPGNQWDCVSLNAAGNPASAWLSYAWVNGRTAILPFSIPSTAGVVYEFRFWQNCNTFLATSPTVTTTPSVTSASVPPANQLPELPRVYVDTATPITAASVTACGSGCNLQAAINAANLGDVIELQAGATYSGKILLPNKTSGTGWIIIRSSAWQSLPPPGTRVGPQHTSLMAKITTNPLSSYEPAVVTQEGAHHYRFIGIEVTSVDPGVTAQQYSLIVIDGSYYDANSVYRVQPTNALTPHHIVLDRCYIHGAPTGEFIRGVLMNGLHIAIVDSYLSNFHSRNGDTQAAIAWNTPGPLKLANNYLEAAGENVMFGGAPSATAGYIPSDIEIRGNFFDKPLSWRPGDPAYAGVPWVVKNLLEFKNGQRALIEGNVFGHHWAGAQSGFYFLITPRGESNQNPWAFTGDITFRYNRILKTTAGPAVNGTDGQVTQKSNRVLFEHNVFENIGAYVVSGAFNGEFAIIGNAIQNLTIRHNTISQTYTPLHFAGDSAGAMNGLTVVDNIFGNAGYGIAGDTTQGVPELNAIAPGWVMRKNAIYGPYPNANGVLQSYYPADDYFPGSQDAVGFANLSGGDYHLAPWSSYKNTGTDGKDVGADIDAVNAATACAISGACGTL